MIDRRHQALVATSIALTLVVSLTACVEASESRPCGSRAAFDTPQEVFETADAVAVGEVTGADTVTKMSDEIASAWSMTVDEWAKGDGEKSISVLVAPDSCLTSQSDTVFADLTGGEKVYVFLSKTDGEWWAVEAEKGAVPAIADGSMPDAWP